MRDAFDKALPTMILCLGVCMIVLAMDASNPYLAFSFGLTGGIAIYTWESAPWNLTRELARVCRRLDMKKVDIVYDSDTEDVMVVIITRDEEVHDSMDITVTTHDAKETT